MCHALDSIVLYSVLFCTICCLLLAKFFTSFYINETLNEAQFGRLIYIFMSLCSFWEQCSAFAFYLEWNFIHQSSCWGLKQNHIILLFIGRKGPIFHTTSLLNYGKFVSYFCFHVFIGGKLCGIYCVLDYQTQCGWINWVVINFQWMFEIKFKRTYSTSIFFLCANCRNT